MSIDNAVPEWKRLELLVTDIQRRLQPEARVRHNHRIKGKSGRWRKVDITVTQTVSGVPILVAFDCKRHTRPVGIREVEAFSGQARDVRANLGIMVSDSGYDDGATASAKELGISLQEFASPTSIDWKELIGDDAWIFLYSIEMRNPRAAVLFKGEDRMKSCPIDTLVFDEQGVEQFNLTELFWREWKGLDTRWQIGDVNLILEPSSAPAFIRSDENLVQLVKITYSAALSALRYPVPLELAGGHVLRHQDQSGIVERQIFTQGIDSARMMTTLEGAKVVPEEYSEYMSQPRMSVDLDSARRYVRLVITNTARP